VTFALARSLLLADAVTPDAMAQALLLSATRGTSLVRALLATRAIDPMRLEHHLDRGEAPYMRHVAPVPSLVQHLPPGLCERLLALPVRRDPRTGTIDVAVVDARDPHAAEEIAFWLRAPVRMVRTSLASMEAALRRVQAPPEDDGVRPLAAPIWVPAPQATAVRAVAETPIYGVPAFDPTRVDDPGLGEAGYAVDDESPTEVSGFPAAANIPIALTRKSLAPVAVFELGPPVIEKDPRFEGEPVLDLRRTKSSAPPIGANAPVPPFEDLGPVLQAMRTADDRDGILDLVVAGVRTAARRVGVLAVRRELLVGWECSPELADRATFRAARLPPDGTVFVDVLAGEGARLVRIPKDATHAPLLAAMRVPPLGEVAMAAVRVEGKPVALVLADEMGDTLVVTRRMEDLAQAAGDALARLLRERRRG